MKITGIEIGEYRQFKNIKFDFTYPTDHPKAGQPLEKVCFIGQSGTGKTTLLNVIWDLMDAIGLAAYSYHARGEIHKSVNVSFPDSIKSSKYSINIEGNSINFDRNQVFDKSDIAFLRHWFETNMMWTSKIVSSNKVCLYIKDSIAREADAFLFDQKDRPQTFSDFIKTDTQIDEKKNQLEEKIRAIDFKKNISLGDMQLLSAWQYLLKEISEYDETTVKKITSIIQNTPKNKVQEELQKWIDADPRHELAEKCLNPVLNKFFLEVDTEAGNVPIALRTKGGIKINSSYLSTGTRQILATSIPLYKFDTTDTVILFDEPERSLFPDIQRGLISYYTSLAPTAQFFFATHSPIIASAFEPCERFILYFDENGEVKFHNGVAPEGDDPNDILRQDFDMAELMLQKGLEAYEEYRHLAMQIRAETDENRKNQLIAERLELGNRYNFAGQYAQSK